MKTDLEKENYIPRDLSWLAFNERVLKESSEGVNPLMERIKFIAITSENLDEFYRVRFAGLVDLVTAEYNRKDDFCYYPQELYLSVKERSEKLITDMYSAFESAKKDLQINKILILNNSQLNPDQKKAAKRYFDKTLFPITTPMAVDPAHPFPVINSKTNTFAVYLERNDARNMALVAVPKSVPRVFKLPSEKDEFCFILIDEIIRENMQVFFRGFNIIDSFEFRVLRNSDMSIDEEFAPDLLKTIENEVRKRPRAPVVSLQVQGKPGGDLFERLLEDLEYNKGDVTLIEGDLDLSYLFEVSEQVMRPDLFYRSFNPAKMEYENIFDKIKEGDFVLHLPYQSFEPTVDLIQTAAKDPNVLAIKLTLYRTNNDSNIIKSLVEAAKNNKQVTVLVELKARFDEERNIEWTKSLEAAGCHVIYGIQGLKVHSKMALVVRKEDGAIRRYVHLSTGNYNEKTSRIYTDIGMFTANDDFAKDVSDMFNVLTGYSLPSSWKRIISSPHDLRKYYFNLIEREMEYQKKYKNGQIFAKINSLEDKKIIDKLYEASQAGVKINLIVRGICCLVPGIEGLSDTIEIKSIVGRFLEHSRIFLFNNNGDQRVFVSSADWMRRSFDRRIELAFEISNQQIKEYLVSVLNDYWKDTIKSRFLTSKTVYSETKKDEKGFNVQEYLIQKHAQ